MKTLPHDVWLHVAQFVPALTLRDMLSVNSSFFNISMDIRYRQMSFAYLDNRMIRNLVRLKDPVVAKRVRILHVYPGFLRETVITANLTPPPLHLTLRHCLVELATHIREQRLFTKHPKFRLVRTLRRTEDVIQVMLDVLGALPNVTDYYVTWTGLPTVGVSAVPFLTTVFQSSLRKLSLDISIENIKCLLSPMCQMLNLEELHICIHYDHAHYPILEYNDILKYSLAPAISLHRTTLQTLVVQSWTAMDLSPFFDAIEHLPVLDTINIGIPVEPPHLGSPSGLVNFLNKHSPNLRCLRLRATQYGGLGLDPEPSALDDWVRGAISDVRLSALRSLDISSPLFPTETSLYCLGHFYRHLTSLSMTGKYRTYDDIADILDIVSLQTSEKPLGKLRLGSVTLSPQLIDLLAKKLPKLYRLELIAKDLSPHALDAPAHLKQSHISHFFLEMSSRKYQFWQLQRMSILINSLPNRSYFEPLIDQLFRSCVPSIRVIT